MIKRDKIIVSITSWHKRIENVEPVLLTILNQTLMPDKILLNLCIQDFPCMEHDLPESLMELVNDNKDIIEIYWFIENYKAWKKHLHAMEIAGPDDLIMSIDDDHLYPEDYIEKMYVSYLFYGKEFPVTLNKDMMFQNLWCFNGPGVLYRVKDFGKDWQRMFTEKVLRECANDIAATLMFAANRTVCLPMMFHMPPDDELLFNDVTAYTDKRSFIKHGDKDAARQIDKIVDLHETTGNALEDTFSRNGMVPSNCSVRPNFWQICFDFADYMKEHYKEPRFPAVQEMMDYNESEPMRPNVYGIDFTRLRLDLDRKNKSELIGNNKLVITIASWTKRIHNVTKVLNDILYNTIPPDVIVLNLARTDFGLELDELPSLSRLYDILPHDLCSLMNEHPEITIHWYNDASVKSWKKHLYVIEHFDKDDVIICIDDDVNYRETFIETMLKSYDFYGRMYPVSGCDCSYVNGMFAFHGTYTLYTPGFFGDFKRYINRDIVHKFPEDNHMGAILAMNGKMILPVIGSDFLTYDGTYNEVSPNYGNGVFDDKWFRDFSELFAASEKIISDERGSDPLLNHGNIWHPLIYNFTSDIVKKILFEWKDKEKPHPMNIIYDSINTHYNENFGDNTDKTSLSDRIRHIIL